MASAGSARGGPCGTAGRGARQLRLDCWADGNQALVRYYERAGFTVTGRVTLPHVPGGWEGIVLTRLL